MTALAASGATALVGLMATEAWNQVRGRVARFLARNDEESAAVDAELEESRGELIGLRAGADEDSAADAEEEWRLRLRRALRTNPEAAELKGAPPPGVGPDWNAEGLAGVHGHPERLRVHRPLAAIVGLSHLKRRCNHFGVGREKWRSYCTAIASDRAAARLNPPRRRPPHAPTVSSP
ncbi:hypothetical protein [Streptomyces sp. NPDC057554]|uniref:hypothetical protein n=1 Tax=Streptomyces sp. NPDC057554 TaxID=3350538 RepID=UPI0036AE1169